MTAAALREPGNDQDTGLLSGYLGLSGPLHAVVVNRPLPAVLAAALLLAAGCSANPQAGAPPAGSSSSTGIPSAAATAVASPTPISTAAETAPSAEAGCEGRFDSNMAILADGWAIVVASKDEPDGPGYVVDFADSVEDLVDDIDDADCATTAQDAAAAGLNYEAGLLALPFNLSPAGDDDEEQYPVVAKAGDGLAAALGVDDVHFVDVDCKGQIDETEECTALS
ncbi:hypothetical protein GCM10009616_35550 [Microlunatus lacustris]